MGEIKGQKRGCFGCRRASPTYKWTDDRKMLVDCSTRGEIPELYECDDHLSYLVDPATKKLVLEGLHMWTEVQIGSDEQGGDPCIDVGIEEVGEKLVAMGYDRKLIVSAFKDPEFFRDVWKHVQDKMLDEFADTVTNKLMDGK